MAIALAFERATGALAVVKRHFSVIVGVGGVVMIALGLLIVTGEFTVLNAQANSWLQGTGLDVGQVFESCARDSAVPMLPGCVWRPG